MIKKDKKLFCFLNIITTLILTICISFLQVIYVNAYRTETQTHQHTSSCKKTCGATSERVHHQVNSNDGGATISSEYNVYICTVCGASKGEDRYGPYKTYPCYNQIITCGISAGATTTIVYCNLTINPNGGTWNGYTSSKTYEQKKGTTKSIANPTRSGYTFSGWSLSGKGSISGGTYTYGSNDGTLTANWTCNHSTSYEVTDKYGSCSGRNYHQYCPNCGATWGYYYNAIDHTYGDYTYTNSNGITNGMKFHECSNKVEGHRKDFSYLVILNKGDGIASVSGGNWYTQGSQVSIDATLNSFYQWKNWNGSTNLNDKNVVLTTSIDKAYELTANGELMKFDVTYKDVVDSIDGEELGSQTQTIAYGSNVRGSDLGLDSNDNVYYNGYYYVSDTNAVVDENGATIYRIFKLRTTNKEVIINWNDDNNVDGLRPLNNTISLYQNGTLFKTQDINEITSYTFNDLPKYDSNGREYEYTYSFSQNDRYVQNIENNIITMEYQESTFSVIIPKTIVMNGETGIVSYIIEVNGILYYNDRINVIPDNSFEVHDRLDYQTMVINIEQEKTIFTKDTLGSANGTIVCSKKEFAGSWNGTFNFNIFLEKEN